MTGAVAPFPDGSRVVHIGLAKTGTTGLQAALHDARPQLATHGVRYVGRRRHSRKGARFAIGAPDPWQVGGDRQWHDLCTELRESDARVTLLSSETLAQARPDAVARIVDQLGEDLRVLITLRALAPLLASAWQQALRRGHDEALDSYLRNTLPEHDTEGGILWHRRFSEHVRVWGAAVGGEDRVTLLVPDPGDRASLLHRAEDLLGLPRETLPPPGRDNASLPYAEAELLRSLNGAYRRAGGDETVWRTTSSYRGEHALASVPVGPDPQPVRIPRWAAERTNALTERWTDEVRRGGAHVVGDLADLLVDPAEHPEEVVAPSTVALPTADAMTRIFAVAALRTDGSGRPADPGDPGDDLRDEE